LLEAWSLVHASLLMKSLLVALFLALSLQAQEGLSDVATLRKSYDDASATVLKPIKERYIADLELMKTRAMSAKNLDLAKAADQEAKSLEADSTSPDVSKFKDLGASRARFEAAHSAALAPLRKRHYEALKGLFDRAIARKDLDAAKAIETEMIEFTDDRELEKKLINTRWQWWKGETIELFAGNKGVYHADANSKENAKWRAVPGGKVLWEQGRNKFVLKFDATKVQITNPEGKTWTGTFRGNIR
jgi:hypothetical protein